MTDQTPPPDRSADTGGSRHPEIEELAAYADGELRAGDRDRVATHLAGCDECGADLEALEQTSAALAALGPVTMPEDVAARLDRALSGLSAPSPAATVLPIRRRRGGGWATGAAAAAVVALVAAVGLSAIKGGSDKKTLDASTSRSGAAAAKAPTRVSRTGTNYVPGPGLQGQIQSVVSQRNSAGTDAQSQDLAAAGEPEASPSATSATGSSATAAAPAASPAPGGTPFASAPKPAAADAAKSAAADDLVALEGEGQRQAACIEAVTEGEQPIAIDFAQWNGKPALVIVLPDTKPSKFVRVYFVGSDCGRTDDARVLDYQVVPTS